MSRTPPVPKRAPKKASPAALRDAIRSEALPSLHWRYSGGGYTVMQQMLLDVTGKTFPKLMEEIVLTPLGMSSSTYRQPLPDEQAAPALTQTPARSSAMT